MHKSAPFKSLSILKLNELLEKWRLVWTLLLAAHLTPSLLFSQPLGLTPAVSAGQSPPQEQEQRLEEMAHMGQWWLQHERDGLHAFDDAEFEKHFLELTAELDVDYSLELDQVIEQILGQIEQAFEQHNPEALPLIGLFRQPEAVAATWAQLSELRGALQKYKLNTQRYPSISEGLPALLIEDGENGPYVSGRKLLDSWGREFHYRSRGEAFFQLRSLGPDGVADTQDDLVGDERGQYNEAPANASSRVNKTCSILRISQQEPNTFVKLVLVTRHLHWDPELVREERSVPVMGQEVLLSIDGVEGTATLKTDAEAWVGFRAPPQMIENRLRAGHDGQIARFKLPGTVGPPCRMYLGLDWALDIVGSHMEGGLDVQLASWGDILAEVPATDSGILVRRGIEARTASLPAQLIQAQWEAQIALKGGLDPATRDARQECMQLQTQLGEALLAAGEPQAAVRAFGNAARHASDNDAIDAMAALIQRQLEAQGTER